MNALDNAHTQPDPRWSACAGITSDASPETQQTQDGVSSNCIPETPLPDHHWYVLRALYNRTKGANDLISDAGIFSYVPKHFVVKQEIGKKRRICKPLLPNLFFVYATRKQTDSLVGKRASGVSCIKYYLDKTRPREANGLHPPLIVPFCVMHNFIKATSTDNEHVRIVTPTQYRHKTGDTVRVTEGAFQGVVGKVARIAGQQRVVVEIGELCAVATAYIPSVYLERLHPSAV